jgi:hypothetical protein
MAKPAKPTPASDKKTEAETDPPKRSFRARGLADLMSDLTRGPFRKRGFAQREIVTRWPEIVGPLLGRHSLPERVRFARDENEDATLVVRAASGFATELQHLEPTVIARINGYFGFRAIGRLSIIQAPLPQPRRRTPQPARSLTSDEESRIAAQAAGLRDPDLAGALKRLGEAVQARIPAKKT